MAKQRTDDLVQLINSLSRAEKRHFRLFVRRNQTNDDILFLQLFDFLEKYNQYNEELILKKLPEIKKRQLSNLKAHLYKQLLTSLRLLSKQENEDIQIRESIDYARVLYNKGLYLQSLSILDKARQKALQLNFSALLVEILDFEKHIESQYITRSIEGRAEELANEVDSATLAISRNNRYSNLALKLYGLYLKLGYARNEKDFAYVRHFFYANLPDIEFKQLDFIGKLHYCAAFCWYNHIVQDFRMSYKYARMWVDLYDAAPEMRYVHTTLYLKGLHNLLNALYHALDYPRFVDALQALERAGADTQLLHTTNTEGLYHLFWYIHTINRHYLEGTFSEGLSMVPQLVALIESNPYYWDDHRIMLFYYKIASLYFGSGDYGQTIHYLNLIINPKNPDYRGDIQAFARILNLIAHFELGNEILVEYQIKSVYRFLSKIEDLQAVQKEIFKFLRKIPVIREEALPKEFALLRKKLLPYQNDPYEKRPFLYLDIISWLESKIQGRSVQDIVREKFLQPRNP